MTPLYPLHNPGCDGDPSTLCDPHPINLEILANEPELFLGALGVSLLVAIAIALYRRARYQRNDEP